ncbi:hypothetical protein PZB75_08630 [Streptomyces sp. AM 4-1-1]|uniref:hypothetical protein n=1 Tax=Streptomyces sp. AM 4-1-1 TaxID=3028710 RepID=UPI0023B8D108|nr:hypothetical protein [Streptomyces sp. AM 4-1-1]WEH33440.1 hypothetical protein PZB75_08630 [Streptomyces sp. AM 4-1-1]
MTHPPNVRTAPEPAPELARERLSAPEPARALAPRGGAWSGPAERLRTAATTEPGRLRIIGAVLALLVVAFGAVTAFEVHDRAAAADDVVRHSRPESADAAAAAVYRSLADADAAAASGFLAGAQEPREVHERYEKDIKEASRLLVKAAAADSDVSTASGREITTLNEKLPEYTGLIERARAHNRQGLPLGGAYLRYANQTMATELLPAAERLYAAETVRLDQDYSDARAWPYVSLVLGVVVLGALCWAQRRTYLRTNRVFNHGLLAATAATTVVLLWLAVGHTVSRSDLLDARVHGQQSVDVLNRARISSLKARADETLTVVARGAVLTPDGKKDKYENDYTTGMKGLGEQLSEAGKLADDSQGKEPVAKAVTGVSEWRERHRAARLTDENGDYDRALKQVIGPRGSTGESFDRVDAELEKALAHERAEFTRFAEGGHGALGGLPVGAAVLAVLGAAGAVVGVNRRLSEYR